MLSLIYSDAIDHPVDGAIFPDNPPAYKEEISLERIQAARKLVEEEVPSVRSELSFVDRFEKARRHVKLDFGHKEARVVPQPIPKE